MTNERKMVEEAANLVIAAGKNEAVRAILRAAADRYLADLDRQAGNDAGWWAGVFKGADKMSASDVERLWDVRGKIVARVKR